MAAPNLDNPTTITGKTAFYMAGTTIGSALSNAAASNKVLKVNVVRAANITALDTTVDISIFRAATDEYLTKGTLVNANASFVASNREEYFYLEEGDSIRALASAATSIEIMIAYEEIA